MGKLQVPRVKHKPLAGSAVKEVPNNWHIQPHRVCRMHPKLMGASCNRSKLNLCPPLLHLNYPETGYSFLPLDVDDNGIMTVKWVDEFTV